jgi:hypothetical protein
MTFWTDLDARLYRFAVPVLSVIDTDGYPFSLRCRVRPDRAADAFHAELPPDAPVAEGPAWLLWHTHDDDFDTQQTLAVSADLIRDDDGWRLRPRRIVGGHDAPPDQVETETARYLAQTGQAAPGPFPWDQLIALARRTRRDPA